MRAFRDYSEGDFQDTGAFVGIDGGMRSGYVPAHPRATHFTIDAGIGRSKSRTPFVFSLAAGMEFFKRDARTR